MNLIIDPSWRWWNSSLLDLLQGLGRRAVALLEPVMAPGKLMAVLLLVFLFVVIHAAGNWERDGAPRWLRKMLDWLGPMTGRRLVFAGIGTVIVVVLLNLRPLVLSVACIMAGVTVWTYWNAVGASALRLIVLIGLRLLAGLSALLMVVQPALTAAGREVRQAKLLLLLDVSASMTMKDEAGKQSRWARLQTALSEAEPLLQRLQKEQGVTVLTYQFAEELRSFDPAARPAGQRTDFGQALASLYQHQDAQEQYWGLLIFSDGVDNGIGYQPLVEAARWRELACPIHTFGLGQSSTEPQPVRLNEGEMERPAADHEFLARLARAGGGALHKIQDLPRCLKALQNTPRPRVRPVAAAWPDWHETTLSEFRMSYLGLLMGLLCLEWLCRRVWGFA